MNNSSYASNSKLLPSPDTASLFGIAATSLENLSLPNIVIPPQEIDKIATLNQTGFMKTELDIFSKKFINYTATIKQPALEIGAAYGIAVIEALKNGSIVIANDIEEKHLIALVQQTPKQLLNNLYIKPGYFPRDLEFQENSIGAILICRVAHFLNGEELEEGFKKIHKWLTPKGKLFFVSMSPYHHILRQEFLPIYLEKFHKGEKWPGIINNMRQYNPQESIDIPEFLHVFDDKFMQAILTKAGFEIEEITLFDYSNNSSNNKGYLGFVAVKS